MGKRLSRLSKHIHLNSVLRRRNRHGSTFCPTPSSATQDQIDTSEQKQASHSANKQQVPYLDMSLSFHKDPYADEKPPSESTAGSVFEILQRSEDLESGGKETSNPGFSLSAHSDLSIRYTLTFSQSITVQDSWNLLSSCDPQQVGVEFLLRFFLNFPNYRNFYQHFKSDSDLSDKEVNCRELRALSDSVHLKELGGAYVKALTDILDQLDNEKDLTQLLRSITDRHYPRGVLHCHFRDMMSALYMFVQDASGSKFTSNARESWLSATCTITRLIEDYYLQLQHKVVITEVEEKKEENDDDGSHIEEKKEENDDDGFHIWGDE